MYDTFSELKNESENSNLAEFIISNQSQETGLSKIELIEKIGRIADSMNESIKKGLASKEMSKSGLSGGDTLLLLNSSISPLISDFQRKAMLYALAVIEENARMGRICACPTAGSSGIVPAVLIAATEEFNKTRFDLINSLIVAGEIGRLISVKIQLAGAVAGCQAECGAAACMASGALCYLFSQDIDVIFNACALTLKNLLGLTCDPVAGLVEVPCVKRNSLLASMAISSAYLAMSGVKSKLPVDDVVDAMKETGILMSSKLKESSEAGLALTKTGIEIRNSLFKIWEEN